MTPSSSVAPLSSAGTAGTWSCDLDTEALTWSDGVYDLFGLPRGTVADRKSSLSLYHPGSRERLTTLRNHALSSGQLFTLDAQIRTPAGIDRWMRIFAHVDRKPGSRPRLYGVKQDVTAEIVGRTYNGLLCDTAANPPDAATLIRTWPARIGALLLIDVRAHRDSLTRYGPAAAGACLRETERRLGSLFPTAHLIARHRDTRYVVLLGAPIDFAILPETMRRPVMTLRRPILWQGVWLKPDTAIGAAGSYEGGSSQPQRLWDQATAALEAARHPDAAPLAIFGQPARYGPDEDLLI